MAEGVAVGAQEHPRPPQPRLLRGPKRSSATAVHVLDWIVKHGGTPLSFRVWRESLYAHASELAATRQWERLKARFLAESVPHRVVTRAGEPNLVALLPAAEEWADGVLLDNSSSSKGAKKRKAEARDMFTQWRRDPDTIGAKVYDQHAGCWRTTDHVKRLAAFVDDVDRFNATGEVTRGGPLEEEWLEAAARAPEEGVPGDGGSGAGDWKSVSALGHEFGLAFDMRAKFAWWCGLRVRKDPIKGDQVNRHDALKQLGRLRAGRGERSTHPGRPGAAA